MAASLEVGQDPRLDLLELRVGQEALCPHLLRSLQPGGRRLAAVAGRSRRGAAETAAEADAAGLGAELLELADAALLAPRLFLRLAGAVDLLGFRLPEAIDLDRPARRFGDREVAAAERRDEERGPEDAGAELGVPQVLPAHVLRGEAAEQPAREHDQAAAGGPHDHSAMREGEQTALDRVALELFARDEQRLQHRDGAGDAAFGRWRFGGGHERS